MFCSTKENDNTTCLPYIHTSMKFLLLPYCTFRGLFQLAELLTIELSYLNCHLSVMCHDFLDLIGNKVLLFRK